MLEQKLQMKTGGLTYLFCAQSIDKAFRRGEGVPDVSLAHEEALARYDDNLSTGPSWSLGRSPASSVALPGQRWMIGGLWGLGRWPGNGERESITPTEARSRSRASGPASG